MNKKIIHEVFQSVASACAQKVAVEEEGRAISYTELNSRANWLAGLLREHGLKNEDIVTVCLMPGIDLVTSLLAISKAGGVYCPIDPSTRPEKLNAFKEEGFLQYFITGSPDLYPAANHPTFNFDPTIFGENTFEWHHDGSIQIRKVSREGFVSQAPPVATVSDPQWVSNPDSPNYIFNTSGTTGVSKAIVGCHKGLSHFIHWQIKEFTIDDGCRVGQLASIVFDASLRDIFVPLCSGGTLCIPAFETKSIPRKLVEWIRHSRISIVHCVPSMLRLITEELKSSAGGNREGFSNLKTVFVSGEPLYTNDIISVHRSLGPQVEVVNLYGLTECTMAQVFYRIKEVAENAGPRVPAGFPISNTVVAIIKNARICRTGEKGEVYIKTPFRTKGYFRNPALTQQTFVPNPLSQDTSDIVCRTGDIGIYHENGAIEILGRADDQIKVNGNRVFRSEIETAAMKVPLVRECVVLDRRNENGQTELLCFYTGEQLTNADLRNHLSKYLNTAVIPSYFVYMPVFPLTKNGKIDRRALILPSLETDQNSDDPYITTTERQLSAVWCELFNRKNIRRKDNFFDLGGNSLTAYRLSSLVYKRFSALVRIDEILKRPTIADQAAFIDTSITGIDIQIPLIEDQEYYAVSDAQKRIWTVQMMNKYSSAYNSRMIFELNGPLDIGKLKSTLAKVLARHASLRTIFIDVDSDLKQRIQPVKDQDLLEVIHVASREDVEGRFLSEQEFSFDLAKGPLFRFVLYALSPERNYFYLGMHHIISDGWSNLILVKELMKLYDLDIGKGNEAIENLPVQYKDYTAWANNIPKSPAFATLRNFWKAQLGGELPVLNLPTDFPRPEVKKFDGSLISFNLGKKVSSELKTLATETGSTLFAVFMTLINILFYKYTKQADIIIGTSVSGREHHALQDQIGVYLNMLPIRTKLDVGRSFVSQLIAVRDNILKIYANQHYPFNLLIENIGAKRDLSRSPVFDIVVTPFVKLGEESTSFGSDDARITVSQFDSELNISTSKYDLVIRFDESEDIRIVVIYNNHIFRRSSLILLKERFSSLINQVVQNPNDSIDSFDIKAGSERLSHIRIRAAANFDFS